MSVYSTEANKALLHYSLAQSLPVEWDPWLAEEMFIFSFFIVSEIKKANILFLKVSIKKNGLNLLGYFQLQIIKHLT